MEQAIERVWALAHEPEGPLVPYLDSFAKSLVEQGFKRRVIGPQIRVAAKLSRWLQAKRISAADVTYDHVRRFLPKPRFQQAVTRGDVASLRRLLNFLIHLGVARTPIPRDEPTPIQTIVVAFASYLREERELSAATRIQYCPFVERFLSERFGNGAVELSELRAVDVIGFIRRRAADLGSARAKAATIALRSFMRYLRYRGDIQVDLAAAVPTVPNWSMTGIPRAIAPDHVRAVLEHCPRDTAIGRRDYAILMLLVRLGLRAGEIVSLTLDSIDWEAGSIAVTGKAGQAARLPLPVDVGESIADYLRHGRPTSGSRALFLRTLAPIRDLGAQQTIATIVNVAIQRAGVDTPTRGTHQFRHALAADMLRHGATLTEIGSLLRHRRSKTTSIYAKVDFVALRPLCLPWPGDAK